MTEAVHIKITIQQNTRLDKDVQFTVCGHNAEKTVWETELVIILRSTSGYK